MHLHTFCYPSRFRIKIFVIVQTIPLHLIKVLLPPQFAHLGTLQLHVLGTRSLGVCLNLALNRGVERAQHAGSKEGSVDAVVDTDCCDGDTYFELEFLPC